MDSSAETELIKRLLTPPTNLKIDYTELCKNVTEEVFLKAVQEQKEGKTGKGDAPFWTVLMTGVVKMGKFRGIEE